MPMIGRHFMPNLHRAAWGFMQSGDFPVPVLHLKFGENTGTEAKDSSPEGNDGDIDGATWVKGYLGPGLLFDALDDVVTVNEELIDTVTGDYTIIVRFKPVASTDTWTAGGWRNMVWGGSPTAVEVGYYNGSGPIMKLNYTDLTTKSVSIYKTTDADEWAMLSVQKSGNTGYAWWNLESVSDDIDPDKTLQQPTLWRFGASTAGTPYTVDEIIFFDEFLSAAQIRQVHQGYR